MAILSKAVILAAVDLKTEDVAVPEWGGEVRVAKQHQAGKLKGAMHCGDSLKLIPSRHDAHVRVTRRWRR